MDEEYPENCMSTLVIQKHPGWPVANVDQGEQ